MRAYKEADTSGVSIAPKNETSTPMHFDVEWLCRIERIHEDCAIVEEI